MGQLWLDGYSAEVELYLLVDGQRYEIAQVSNGAFILRDARTIPPNTKATLVIKIDGHEEREEIFLAAGVENNEQLVPFI